MLLVDVSDLFHKGRSQNTLEQEHVKTIFEAYEKFADEEGRCHVATLDEIREQGGNLKPCGLHIEARRCGHPVSRRSNKGA